MKWTLADAHGLDNVPIALSMGREVCAPAGATNGSCTLSRADQWLRGFHTLIVAPADQLGWLAERLGSIAFANPTLLLYAGTVNGIVEPGVNNESDTVLRQDCRAIQCPRCRRQTA